MINIFKDKRVQEISLKFLHFCEEYARTIAISFLAALVITVLITIHAKNDMVRDYYANIEEQIKMDERIAKQLVLQSDLMKDLKDKKFSICSHVGDIYFAAHDYENAELAYKTAFSKRHPRGYVLYYKLVYSLAAQKKFKEAAEFVESVPDLKKKELIKFKSNSFLAIGDRYYSSGKFLSAAKCYVKAELYYNKLIPRNQKFQKKLISRIVNSYIEAADVMVKHDKNGEAIKLLKLAENYEPDNLQIIYKLAIIYSDADPLKAVDYLERLLKEEPQDLDYDLYCRTMLKAASIKDLEGDHTLAKYYRYRIHSVDLFLNNKVIYKNDIDIYLNSFIVRKIFFRYKLKGLYQIANISHSDIKNLSADFVLKNKDKVVEIIPIKIVDASEPLTSNGGKSDEFTVTFGKNIFTKKELENYTIDIYLYKIEKFKTLVATMQVPLKTIKRN